LAKELEVAHPRRTYYYLTTYPHLPIPDLPSSQLSDRHIISPSLSSTASHSDECEDERRRELSPSPEIDLSTPELDDIDDDIAMPATPIGSLPNLLRALRDQRGVSPPLEKDEREFTQTADVLQKRKLGEEMGESATSGHLMDIDDCCHGESLFGEARSLAIPVAGFLASPAIRPSLVPQVRKDWEPESLLRSDGWSKVEKLLEWDYNLENIELEELDCLLDGC
jgi:hypothetical protein